MDKFSLKYILFNEIKYYLKVDIYIKNIVTEKPPNIFQ